MVRYRKYPEPKIWRIRGVREQVTDAPRLPNAYDLAILQGLGLTGRHVYAGTVTDIEVARRRRRNRVARGQRVLNERGAR